MRLLEEWNQCDVRQTVKLINQQIYECVVGVG